jgi:hypothetical protein
MKMKIYPVLGICFLFCRCGMDVTFPQPLNGTYTFNPRPLCEKSGLPGREYLARIVFTDFRTILYFTNTPAGDGNNSFAFVPAGAIIEDTESERYYTALEYDNTKAPLSVSFVRIRTNHFRIIDGTGERLFREIKLDGPSVIYRP